MSRRGGDAKFCNSWNEREVIVPISVLDAYFSRHYVWPADLDLLGHMNNGRYFTITDIIRIEMFIRAGIWAEMKRRGLYAVMAGETVQFRKPLKPFQRYDIITKTLGWDDKFFYVEHKFVSQQGLHALMMLKAMVLGSKQVRVKPSEVLKWVHSEEIEAVRSNGLIEKWAESSMMHWNENNFEFKSNLSNPLLRSEGSY